MESRAASAIVGDAEPLCFYVPTVEFRFAGELLAAFRDLGNFVIRIIVIEARSHSFADQVRFRIASVQSQITEFRIRNLIQLGRHD